MQIIESRMTRKTCQFDVNIAIKCEENQTIDSQEAIVTADVARILRLVSIQLS